MYIGDIEIDIEGRKMIVIISVGLACVSVCFYFHFMIHFDSKRSFAYRWLGFFLSLFHLNIGTHCLHPYLYIHHSTIFDFIVCSLFINMFVCVCIFIWLSFDQFFLYNMYESWFECTQFSRTESFHYGNHFV